MSPYLHDFEVEDMFEIQGWNLVFYFGGSSLPKIYKYELKLWMLTSQVNHLETLNPLFGDLELCILT